MTSPVAPQIECEQLHPIIVVRDIQAAIDFYTAKLGFTFSFIWGDPPSFAGLMLGNVQIFLQKGKPVPRASGVAFVVGNADELFAFHVAGGVTVSEPIEDRDYGIRDYSIRDLDDNDLSFGHHLFSTGDPIEIERVDVPLRLEKRLAALLSDLAEHKRMSLNSCVEEILLHTNEPYGNGVASPHTKGQIRFIQELKQKHGIDYDSHASYRFVEKR